MIPRCQRQYGYQGDFTNKLGRLRSISSVDLFLHHFLCLTKVVQVYVQQFEKGVYRLDYCNNMCLLMSIGD